MTEVVTIGEAMLRTVDSQSGPLQTVGGAELNTAVALSQLGRNVCWISSVGNDSAGHKILNHSKSVGVDVSAVTISEKFRTGEYFVDFNEKRVDYNRENSAFANLSYTMLDPSLRTHLQGAKWLHLTGITPLLSEKSRGLWSTSMSMAELDGVNISLDFNYRPSLSKWNELWNIIEPHLRKIHFLTLSQDDLSKINNQYGLVDDDSEINTLVVEIRKRWLITWVACTFKELNADGTQNRWSVIAGPKGVYSSRKNQTNHVPVEPLGGGDAWISAVIDGLLSNMELKEIVHRADRYASLVQSCPGDLSTITKIQLDGSFTAGTLERLKKCGTIAILRGHDSELMFKRAQELIDSGITAIEVTLDSEEPFKTLQRIQADSPPNVLIGVGTVSNPISQLERAIKLGIVFCLSPNYPKGMIEVSENLQILPIVGASNSEEVVYAKKNGAKAVKLFHANDDWTEEDLVILKSKHEDLVLIPVGGIGPQDREKWSGLGFELLGMGSKLSQLGDE